MLHIHDGADQFRIALSEYLNEETSAEASQHWRQALEDPSAPTVIVDISGIIGFDRAGARFLQEITKHGTQIVARNPVSLSLLQRALGRLFRPALVYSAEPKRPGKESQLPRSGVVLTMKAASGK